MELSIRLQSSYVITRLAVLNAQLRESRYFRQKAAFSGGLFFAPGHERLNSPNSSPDPI